MAHHPETGTGAFSGTKKRHKKSRKNRLPSGAPSKIAPKTYPTDVVDQILLSGTARERVGEGRGGVRKGSESTEAADEKKR